MPKRKAVQPLQRLCLENIAKNMQLFWAKDYTDNYLDEYQFRYIMGPFSELAGSLVQELLQLMGERRCLTRAVLHLLVVPQLKELSLSACPKLVSKAITQIITVRCKNLSSLDLQGCSRIPTDALVDLMEGLPGLTKLDLSETQCNTQVLSAVGSCCQQLRELDISLCKRLSPASLLHLAYDPTAGSLCCPALQVLCVDGLCPTAHSQDLFWVLAFLLLALPSLKSLENEFLTDALCLIHKQKFKSAPITPGFPSLEELARGRMSACADEKSPRLTLPLKEIIEVSEEAVPMVCAVCPHLAKASVNLEDGRRGLSQTFLSWHHLTHLTLDGSEMRGLRALREILPVMAHIGGQLQSLALDGFSADDELSFHTLLGHCPNLRKLSASLFYSARPRHGEPLKGDASLPPHKFPQLCDFSLLLSDLHDALLSRQAVTLRASLVSLLKHSPALETVHLSCLPFSLDEVFEAVLQPRGAALRHLCDLSLSQCKVSSKAAHLLLSSDNRLRSLHLYRCPEIHRRDYDKLLRRVGKESLELQIQWD
ncbi:uncharacterized protein LOC134404873 [Elgaria multicarinata webbii]|uniref:uncharacterized protein LOC134404873 n=1 Tax=Elgaria multicarinata webbii TaxID=159646 RepID=UPI002FCCDC1E